jgi:tyrosine-protein phosphatase SIW14
MVTPSIRNVYRASVLTLAPALLLVASAYAQQAPAGVTNFHVVNDHVYRGGQPSDAGFQALAKIGVKTVLDLREPDSRSQAEKKVVEAAGMKYVNIPFYGISTPSAAQVANALSILSNKDNGSVFVHCRRGSDRTGTVIAAYRVSHDGWNNAKALDEAKGYGMTFLAVGMHHFIRDYRAPVQNADAAATAPAVN